jgi:hypothetical protein
MEINGLDCDPTTPAEFHVENGVAGTINSIKGWDMPEETQRLENAGVRHLCPIVVAHARRLTTPAERSDSTGRTWSRSSVPTWPGAYGSWSYDNTGDNESLEASCPNLHARWLGCNNPSGFAPRVSKALLNAVGIVTLLTSGERYRIQVVSSGHESGFIHGIEHKSLPSLTMRNVLVARSDP